MTTRTSGIDHKRSGLLPGHTAFKILTMFFIFMVMITMPFIAGCSSDDNGYTGDAAPGNGVTPEVSGVGGYSRSNEGRGVWIDILLVNPPETGSNESLAEELVFEVNMTTHSGDLLSYDIVSNAVLVIDGTPIEAAPSWRYISEDAHHPTGLLTYSVDAASVPDNKIKLILLDLADEAERVFEWALWPS